MRSRQLAGVICTNVGLALGGLVILELSFGGWIGKHGLRRFNIPREIRVTASTGDLYDDPSGTIVVYSRDEHGLRGPYQDPSQIDVLTLVAVQRTSGISQTGERGRTHSLKPPSRPGILFRSLMRA